MRRSGDISWRQHQSGGTLCTKRDVVGSAAALLQTLADWNVIFWGQSEEWSHSASLVCTARPGCVGSSTTSSGTTCDLVHAQCIAAESFWQVVGGLVLCASPSCKVAECCNAIVCASDSEASCACGFQGAPRLDVGDNGRYMVNLV